MKNCKKGFTLVELVLSITLLSIVLIFMMSMLVALKDKESSNGADAKLLVNQAIIAKTVNGDILDKGLETISPCSNPNCYVLSFSNGEEKTLKLMSNSQTLFYGSEKQTDFIRTLPSGRTYSSIKYYVYSNLEIIRISLNKVFKNEDYDIEIYNYMGNKKTNSGDYTSSGLILHYDALNNAGSSHNPSSPMWIDLTNKGNNSSLEGLVAANSSKYSGWMENALILDGENDGLFLGNMMSDLFNSSFTIEFAVSKDKLNDLDTLISNCNESNCNSISIDSNNKNKITIDGESFVGISEDPVFNEDNINTVVTLAYTFDKANGKINTYVDGKLKEVIDASILVSYNSAFNNVYIGRSKTNLNGAFEGKIYSVRIYSILLNNVKLNDNAKVDKKRFIDQIIYNVGESSLTPKEFIPPISGYYKIELWGASGADDKVSDHIDKGGGGAYVSGIINLKSSDKLYIYIGKKGVDYAENGSGGEESDIRLIGGEYSNIDSLRSRIIVAGGGGAANSDYDVIAGSCQSCDSNGCVEYSCNEMYLNNGVGAGKGGSAGGLEGYSGVSIVNTYHLQCKQVGTGGTQIDGGKTIQYAGSGCENATAKTGMFGLGISTGYNHAGGGGYYNGGASSNGGSGGGSSYISGHTGCVAVSSASSTDPLPGCETGTSSKTCSVHYSKKVFSDTVMIDGDGNDWTNINNGPRLMPNPEGGFYNSGEGHIGNGVVRITYLGSSR